MAPPQTANGGRSEKNSKSTKNSASKSGTSQDSRPTSFISRLFTTNSDKQRRQQQQQKNSGQMPNPKDAEASASSIVVPERRVSTPVASNGSANVEADRRPSVATNTKEGKIGLKSSERQPQPAYSTSSLGRYATRLKQHLSPPVFIYAESAGDYATIQNPNEKLIETGSVKDLANTITMPCTTKPATSLKALSSLSTTKRDLKLGAGSENDLCTSAAQQVEATDDYHHNLISAIGVATTATAAAPRSDNANSVSAAGTFPASTTACAPRGIDEINKKSESLISGSAGFSGTRQRSHQLQRAKTTTTEGGNGKVADRGSSVSASSGSISKSALSSGGGGGLASKISRGIIQEFASSSERLMSWKAKLKKTKHGVSPATAGQGAADEAEEDDDEEEHNAQEGAADSEIFERQSLVDFAARSDPLPRAPKYIYKTNSVDSNYDMAMGAYDTGDTNLDQRTDNQHQHWMMGNRRQHPGHPDGFYVGLTLVNTGAVETDVADGMDKHGAYFPNNSDSSTTAAVAATIATGTSGSGAGVRGGSLQKSQRVAPHFSQHPPSSVLEEGQKSSTAALLVDDSAKHYDEIDLATLHWKEVQTENLNMEGHHGHYYQHHPQSSGVYNVQKQHGGSYSGFNPKNMGGEEHSQLAESQTSSANDDVRLPPPTRITPYSGVPQAKDGEIVKPIAFRPIAPSGTRSKSISNPASVSNEIVVVTPMKQVHLTSYRHSSPITESNHYDNANVEPSHRKTSAFTPPSVRRFANHLSVAASAANADSQSMPEDDDRFSSCSRGRETHSMTPARTVYPQQQQVWHQQVPQSQNTTGRVAQPPPAQPRPHPISYQDYLRSHQNQTEQQRMPQVGHVKPNTISGGTSNANQAQNEYDTIGEVRPQQANRSNLPITPNGNRSFDFSVASQQKSTAAQHPVPPMRNTASLAAGHHHSQQVPGHQSGTAEGGVSGGSQNYGSLGSRNSSGIHVTPSPSDSGVAELELALREKENELIHLRQTMEHNEQAIVRVYQEKEQRWQEKLRDWAIRIEHAVSAEQRFLAQVDQLQNERTELHNRVQVFVAEKQGLQRKCKELESELFAAKARLDERRQTNWIVCKQCGCVLTFESRANATSTTSPDDDMLSSRDSQHLPDPPYPPSSQSPRIRYPRTPPPPTIADEAPPDNALRSEVESLKTEVSGLRQSLHDQVAAFNAERRRWEAEKQRVLQYQKLLEDAYRANSLQQQHQEQRPSAHSTPTGTLKSGSKEFSVHPYAYGSLQHGPSPYHHGSTGASLNLIHSEPELEV